MLSQNRKTQKIMYDNLSRSDTQQFQRKLKQSPSHSLQKSKSPVKKVYNQSAAMISILQQKIKILIKNNNLPFSYYDQFQKALFSKFKNFTKSKDQYLIELKEAYNKQIENLVNENSFGQKISNLLQKRSQIIKEIKMLMYRQKNSPQKKQTINLSYVSENLIHLRDISLRVIEHLALWKNSLSSKQEDEYSKHIVQSLTNDVQFLRQSPLRKFLEFSSSQDPLFLHSVKKFQNLQLKSNYNSRPILNFLEVYEKYKKRLVNANKFIKNYDPTVITSDYPFDEEFQSQKQDPSVFIQNQKDDSSLYLKEKKSKSKEVILPSIGQKNINNRNNLTDDRILERLQSKITQILKPIIEDVRQSKKNRFLRLSTQVNDSENDQALNQKRKSLSINRQGIYESQKQSNDGKKSKKKGIAEMALRKYRLATQSRDNFNKSIRQAKKKSFTLNESQYNKIEDQDEQDNDNNDGKHRPSILSQKRKKLKPINNQSMADQLSTYLKENQNQDQEVPTNKQDEKRQQNKKNQEGSSSKKTIKVPKNLINSQKIIDENPGIKEKFKTQQINVKQKLQIGGFNNKKNLPNSSKDIKNYQTQNQSMDYDSGSLIGQKRKQYELKQIIKKQQQLERALKKYQALEEQSKNNKINWNKDQKSNRKSQHQKSKKDEQNQLQKGQKTIGQDEGEIKNSPFKRPCGKNSSLQRRSVNSERNKSKKKDSERSRGKDSINSNRKLQKDKKEPKSSSRLNIISPENNKSNRNQKRQQQQHLLQDNNISFNPTSPKNRQAGKIKICHITPRNNKGQMGQRGQQNQGKYFQSVEKMEDQGQNIKQQGLQLKQEKYGNYFDHEFVDAQRPIRKMVESPIRQLEKTDKSPSKQLKVKQSFQKSLPQGVKNKELRKTPTSSSKQINNSRNKNIQNTKINSSNKNIKVNEQRKNQQSRAKSNHSMSRLSSGLKQVEKKIQPKRQDKKQESKTLTQKPFIEKVKQQAQVMKQGLLQKQTQSSYKPEEKKEVQKKQDIKKVQIGTQSADKDFKSHLEQFLRGRNINQAKTNQQKVTQAKKNDNSSNLKEKQKEKKQQENIEKQDYQGRSQSALRLISNVSNASNKKQAQSSKIDEETKRGSIESPIQPRLNLLEKHTSTPIQASKSKPNLQTVGKNDKEPQNIGKLDGSKTKDTIVTEKPIFKEETKSIIQNDTKKNDSYQESILNNLLINKPNQIQIKPNEKPKKNSFLLDILQQPKKDDTLQTIQEKQSYAEQSQAAKSPQYRTLATPDTVVLRNKEINKLKSDTVQEIKNFKLQSQPLTKKQEINKKSTVDKSKALENNLSLINDQRPIKQQGKKEQEMKREQPNKQVKKQQAIKKEQLKKQQKSKQSQKNSSANQFTLKPLPSIMQNLQPLISNAADTISTSENKAKTGKHQDLPQKQAQNLNNTLVSKTNNLESKGNNQSQTQRQQKKVQNSNPNPTNQSQNYSAQQQQKPSTTIKSQLKPDQQLQSQQYPNVFDPSTYNQVTQKMSDQQIVSSNQSTLTLPNAANSSLTKCIFQTRSFPSPQLSQFLRQYKIPQNVISQIEFGYFSHRQLSLNICWLNNEVISIHLTHPTIIASQRYIVVVLFKVVSEKYLEIASRLFATTIKYLFYNDPCQNIICLKLKTEYEDRSDIQIQKEFVKQVKNIRGKIKNIFIEPASIIPSTFQDTSYMIARKEMGCKNAQIYINNVEFQIQIIGKPQTKIPIKIGNLQISQSTSHQIKSGFSNKINSPPFMTFNNKKQMCEYFKEEQIEGLDGQESLVNIKQNEKDLRVYEKLWLNFSPEIKFSSYGGVYYFLLQQNKCWYWEINNVGFFILKCQTKQMNPSKSQQLNQGKQQKLIEYYFIFMDYVFETENLVNSTDLIKKYIEEKSAGQVLKTQKAFEGKVVTLPCFQSKKTIDSFEANKLLINLRMGLNWKSYIKGVRSVPQQQILSQFIAPFYFGVLKKDQNDTMRFVCGAHISKDEQNLDQ